MEVGETEISAVAIDHALFQRKVQTQDLLSICTELGLGLCKVLVLLRSSSQTDAHPLGPLSSAEISCLDLLQLNFCLKSCLQKLRRAPM